MLNANSERELAYVVLIDGIEPITGSDNCECAIIGGWHIMVRKNQFNIGDPAIYFEIDSKVPSTNPAFSFLEKRNYKVKTQKFTFGGKGNFISQGLLMHAEDFGWKISPTDSSKTEPIGIIDDKGSNTLVVHLDQIEKLRGALSAVSLQSICFDDKTTIILFLLKT